MLRLGSAGPEVETLHQILVEQGFDPGEDEWSTPRTFGPETEEAVKHFQAAHVGQDGRCLVADGIVGSQTWWALEHPSAGHQDNADGATCPRDQTASNIVAAAALDAFCGEYEQGVHEIPDGSNRGPRIDVYNGMEGKGYIPDFPGPPW